MSKTGLDNERNEKCFVCWEAHERNKTFSNGDLNGQLSVVLLIRKILGIRQDVLSNLISVFGNPGDWGVKLCCRCSRLFSEAEFIHRRLIKFHADFEELAKEMRTLLLSSVERDNNDAKRGTPRDTITEKEIEAKSPPIKRRGVGRPRRRAPLQVEREELEEVESANALKNIRDVFLKDSLVGLLDLREPMALYSSSIKGDGKQVVTSVPIVVRVCENNEDKTAHIIRARPKPAIVGTLMEPTNLLNKPDVNRQSTRETLADDNLEELDSANNAFPPASVIKMELHNDEDFQIESVLEDAGNWEADDDMSGFISNDADVEMPSLDNESENENDSDSDYIPESDVEKKKANTRTRRNCQALKNVNKKQACSIGAKTKSQIYHSLITESFQKVPQEIDIQPVADNGRFKCTNCDRLFQKKFDCCIHVLRSHYDDPMPYHCHVCSDKRFNSEKSFRKHLTRFHLGVKCPYDEDYDPETHSAAKLKESALQDSLLTGQNVPGHEQNTNRSLDTVKNGKQILPNIPDEVLAKFQDSPNEIFRCRECSRKFYNEMLRDGHEKRIHQGIEKPFGCDYCRRVFDKRTKLFEHLALSHFSNQLSCPQCGSRFSDKILLDGHVRRVHFGDQTPFKCTGCAREFHRRTKLNAHMRKKHGTRIPPISRKRITKKMIAIPKIKDTHQSQNEGLGCWICDGPLKFDTTQEKDEHMEANHTGVKKPFKCTVKDCTKSYAVQSLLDNHLAKSHNLKKESEPEPQSSEFSCPECSLTFSEQTALDVHVADHEISPYVCTFCGKQFKEKYYLQHHEQQRHYKELNIQPYKCEECGKILNTAKSLKHHVIIVHQKKPRYKCNECSFGCMYPGGLQNHIRTQHLKIKSAICPICSQTFAHDNQLTAHMRIHTGEKPYQCIECGKAFSDGPTFNRHKEAHKGRIHKCPVESCPKQFNTRHAFRIHLKQHQKKGIMVEIPEFRYETDEESQSLQDGKSSVEPDNENGLVSPDLPILKEEAAPLAPSQIASDSSGLVPSNVAAEIINGPNCIGDNSNDPEPPVLLPEASQHIT